MSGYCTSTAVFRLIDKKDMVSVEQFVREELSVMWLNKSVELLYGFESKDAFGPFYALDPARFKFLPGDRKLIEILVNHVNGFETQEVITTGNTENSMLVKNSNSAELLTKHDFAYRTIFFLNKLKSVADINLKKKSKEGFRFDEEIQMYAAYLRMLCGPLAYNTIQRNLEGALP